MCKPTYGLRRPPERRLCLRHHVRVLKVAPQLRFKVGRHQRVGGGHLADEGVLENVAEGMQRVRVRMRGLLNYPFLSTRDPLIARIRGNADLESLLERVRQSWETFEARVSAPPQPSPASTTDPSSGKHP